MPIALADLQSLTPSFYLIGDDTSAAQTVAIDPSWKLEDVKRSVGGVLHVAQPLGTY